MEIINQDKCMTTSINKKEGNSMLFTLKKLANLSFSKQYYGIIRLDKKSDVLKSGLCKILRVVHVYKFMKSIKTLEFPDKMPIHSLISNAD